MKHSGDVYGFQRTAGLLSNSGIPLNTPDERIVFIITRGSSETLRIHSPLICIESVLLFNVRV